MPFKTKVKGIRGRLRVVDVKSHLYIKRDLRWLLNVMITFICMHLTSFVNIYFTQGMDYGSADTINWLLPSFHGHQPYDNLFYFFLFYLNKKVLQQGWQPFSPNHLFLHCVISVPISTQCCFKKKFLTCSLCEPEARTGEVLWAKMDNLTFRSLSRTCCVKTHWIFSISLAYCSLNQSPSETVKKKKSIPVTTCSTHLSTLRDSSDQYFTISIFVQPKLHSRVTPPIFHFDVCF